MRRIATSTEAQPAPSGAPLKKLVPDWHAADPFEHLPKFPMRIEEMDGKPQCHSCGQIDEQGVYYVRVEKHNMRLCHPCLIQQVRASATRDTLVRIIGVIYPGAPDKGK